MEARTNQKAIEREEMERGSKEGIVSRKWRSKWGPFMTKRSKIKVPTYPFSALRLLRGIGCRTSSTKKKKSDTNHVRV